MQAVLLDTNVFSYLLKAGDTRADLYRPHVTGKTIAISFVTVGELYAWSILRKFGTVKLAELETRIRAAVIVPYDLEVCKQYASLAALKNPDGSSRTLPANDRWIAACALRHGLPLVTHNRKHFEGIEGLIVISETPTPAAPTAQTLPLGDSETRH